jgi:hypothetical protein
MLGIEGRRLGALDWQGDECEKRGQQGEWVGQTRLDHGSSSSWARVPAAIHGKKEARHLLRKQMPGAT